MSDWHPVGGSANEVLAAELASTWRTNLGRAASGAPAVGRRVVALMSFDRHLTVLDGATGARLWRRRLNAGGASGVLLDGDRLYAATGGEKGRIYALRLADGDRLWATEVGFVSNPLAARAGTIAAATTTGRVVALDSADGSVRWRRGLGGVARSGVAIDADAVLAATDDSLFKLSVTSGETLAAVSLPGALVTPPVVTPRALIASSPDGYVAGFARDDLRQLWLVDVGEPVFGGPAIARDTVFVVTLDGRLWSIPLADPARGHAIELSVPVRASPAPLADGVLIGTVDGEILFASGPGGAPTPRARVDGPIEHAPVVRRGTLLVVDGRGRMHAWK